MAEAPFNEQHLNGGMGTYHVACCQGVCHELIESFRPPRGKDVGSETHRISTVRRPLVYGMANTTPSTGGIIRCQIFGEQDWVTLRRELISIEFTNNPTKPCDSLATSMSPIILVATLRASLRLLSTPPR